MQKGENRQAFEPINYDFNLPFRLLYLSRPVSKSTGEFEENKPFIWEHWHRDIEICYHLNGNSMYYIDGKLYEIQSGNIIVINSESIHRRIKAKNEWENGLEIIILNINFDFLAQLIPDIGEQCFVTKKGWNSEEAAKIMKELASLKTLNKRYGNIKIRGLLYELIYILCENLLEAKDIIIPINRQKNLERLRGIISYLNAHYTENISQKCVAEKFYFSQVYFSRFFKKNIGMTYKQYISQMRVDKAQKMLRLTDKSVTEIMLECGFPDDRSAIKAFKDAYGVTPLSFRMSNRENKL